MTRPSPDRPWLVAAAVLAVAIAAGCGSAGPTSTPRTTQPAPTTVPGGITPPPDPLPSDVTTTETEWGTILDAVPTTFPVFPGARPAELLDEPASAAWLVSAEAEEIARWYADAMPDAGWGTIETGGPLEDGSWVLDAWADIPECRAQLAVRPGRESTIITALYAAACAGGEG